MKKHWLYFKYLIRHKWYVFRACAEFGLIYRGLKHDWSKFLPSEWFPYVESFYGEGPALRKKAKINMSSAADTFRGKQIQDDFDRAWQRHIKRNPHHWQHHVLLEDSGDIKALRMSVRDTVEMVCDWRGAGLAITGKDNIQEWYEKTKPARRLHPYTLQLVEQLVFGELTPDNISIASVEDET